MSTCGDPGREWATAGSRDPFSMAAGLVQGRLQQFAELLLTNQGRAGGKGFGVGGLGGFGAEADFAGGVEVGMVFDELADDGDEGVETNKAEKVTVDHGHLLLN